MSWARGSQLRERPDERRRHLRRAAALRELVQALGRRYHIVCAQVAVQPLAEVCFPHYVVCNDPTIEQTVTRFGKVVMNLVRKTLSA
jgi:hypothetical protein